MSKKRENRDPWAFASKRRLEARIGSKPVQQEFFERMNDYANFTDGFFNGPKGTPKRVGFVLLIFPFGGGEGHRTNYISNASRDGHHL